MIVLLLLWKKTKRHNIFNMDSIPWLGDVKNKQIILLGANLRELNQILNQKSLDEVLLWAYHVTTSGRYLLPVTSFGLSGLVILHRMKQLGLLDTVVSIDTLHLFPETYDFIQLWKRENHQARVFIYKPVGFEDREHFDEVYGSNFFKEEPEKYAYLTKVEPLQRALYEHQAKIWVTGRRRSQGGERTFLDIIELDDSSSQHSPRWKLNPLAHWSMEEVLAYIQRHKIPYNRLYDQGYTSIGDVHTTSRTLKGAPERSGRFTGHGNRTECGIHLTGTEKKTTVVCKDCLELNSETLNNWIASETRDLLLEFYTPSCLYCQEFALVYEQVASVLSRSSEIQVARFDITGVDVSNMGFLIESIPVLYLVQQRPNRIIKYQGSLFYSPILQWVEENKNRNVM